MVKGSVPDCPPPNFRHQGPSGHCASDLSAINQRCTQPPPQGQLINSLEQLTELRGTFAYVYEFILKGIIKDTE